METRYLCFAKLKDLCSNSILLTPKTHMLLKIILLFQPFFKFSSVHRHVCPCVVVPPPLVMTPSTLGESEDTCHCANLSPTIWPVAMALTNLYCSLEGVSFIQQISDQLLCDRKLGRYLCAALDYFRVTAVQIMCSIETVISPVIGSRWDITN